MPLCPLPLVMSLIGLAPMLRTEDGAAAVVGDKLATATQPKARLKA